MRHTWFLAQSITIFCGTPKACASWRSSCCNKEVDRHLRSVLNAKQCKINERFLHDPLKIQIRVSLDQLSKSYACWHNNNNNNIIIIILQHLTSLISGPSAILILGQSAVNNIWHKTINCSVFSPITQMIVGIHVQMWSTTRQNSDKEAKGRQRAEGKYDAAK
jgi:hypothetical protein